MKTPPSTPEAALQALLQSLSTEPFGRFWLSERPQSKSLLELLDLSQANLAAVLRERLAGLASARDLARTPIIGVCGTVNSGKSTLVASFLSEANRPRVLIGDRAQQATQQFVFWLPESARQDAGFLDAFTRQFQAHFRASPIRLSERPDEAASQVNAGSAGAVFALPLLAFDPRLESCHLGFLDCPDIQRIDEEVPFGSNPRLNALIHGARLCSAFIVVANRDQLGAHTVRDLLLALIRHAPGLPLFLAVNKAGPERAPVLEDASDLLKRWGVAEQVRDVFHAEYVAEAYTRQVWPDFRNARGDSLAALPADLALSDLGRQHLHSAFGEMSTALAEGGTCLRAAAARDQRDADKVAAHVSQFLREHFIDDNNQVRLLYSTAVSRQMIESLQRTAPLAIRVALTSAQPLQWLGRAVREKWDQLRLKRFLSSWGGSAQPEEALHKSEPDDFIEHMLPLQCLRSNLEATELRRVWAQSMQALAEHESEQTALEDASLDPILERMWEGVSKWKQVTLAAALPVSLLVCLCSALLFSWIDFGATAVLSASVPELLASLGISLIVNQVAMADLNELLAKRIGLRQMANLHAALMDGLTLPRPGAVVLRRRGVGRGRRRFAMELPEPDLRQLPAVTRVLDRPLLQLLPEAEARVTTALETAKNQLLRDDIP